MGLWMVAALIGCENMAGGREPENSGFLPSYDGLQKGGYFRKMAIDAEVDLRGFNKVRVSRVEVSRAVGIAWQKAEVFSAETLTTMVGALRRGLNRELGTRFGVLQDDSLVDDKTVVIRIMITRLTPVRPPDVKSPSERQPRVTRVKAGGEIAVWKGLEPLPFMRIKDWRAGRQTISGGQRVAMTDYGAAISIFRFWGRRLSRVLLKLRGGTVDKWPR